MVGPNGAFPGGKIKWAERTKAALRPRILEETGLKISGIKFLLVQDCIHSKEFYRDETFCPAELHLPLHRKNPRVKLNDEGANSDG